MESSSQCPRRTVRTWRPLLGHLRASGDLADRPPVLNPVPPPWLAKSATRFRHGIPSGACRDASLHEIAPRVQA